MLNNEARGGSELNENLGQLSNGNSGPGNDEDIFETVSLFENQKFHGLLVEDPLSHLNRFERLCGIIKKYGLSVDAFKLKLFPFSLGGEAEEWEWHLSQEGSITSWDECKKAFLAKFYPNSRTAMFRKNISGFVQNNSESFADAWERFMSYQFQCPHHGFSDEILHITFYWGVLPNIRMLLDVASNGSFLKKNVADGWETVENFATSDANYGDDYGWNSWGTYEPYSVSKEIKALNEKLDKLELRVATCEKQMHIVCEEEIVVDEKEYQIEEVSFMQNQGNYKSYNAYKQNPNMSYRSNNVANPQVQDYPPNPQQSRMDNRGQRLLHQRLREERMLVACRNDIHRYDASFIAVYKSLIPAEEELEKQRQLMAQLEYLVAKEWPHAKLCLYGSCANSFGFPKSDIDVCLAIEDDDINKSEMLLKLADILKSDNLQNVQAITGARVPIVKLMDPVTGLSCDICINNELAVENTKLLRDYAQIDVRLRQLAFIVKHWAKWRRVNETYQGTLSSYAYVLMCIHFLQRRRPEILPFLQEMKPTYSFCVDNIRCSYFDNVDTLDNFGSSNRETIAELVSGFFNYWAYAHDYANTVVSVRTSSIVGKQEKDWTRRVGNDSHLICIEDPFDTSHDLGRVVNSFSIRVLREEFERAAEIMHHDPNPCAKLLEPYLPEDNYG